MPDAAPAGTAISDLLDAIFTSASSATDYRGTAIPAANTWTWNRRRPTVVTEEVDAAPPAGTAMTKTPRLAWAGRIANAGTMASPDTSAASVLQAGICKNAGAYSDWSSATPWTSGDWFGYWRAALVAANTAATLVRTFISAESVLVQIATTAAVQSWSYLGAIGEPYDADTTLSGETDNRLYGMITSGGAAVMPATWLSAVTSPFSHSTTANSYHGGVFTPNAGTIITGGRRSFNNAAPAALCLQTPSGVYVGDIMEFGKTTATNATMGVRMGTIRGLFCAGQVQSGRYLRNGATDLYHYVSMDTSAPGDGMMITASP